MNAVFHHISHLDNHRLFDWHSISRTQATYSKINFNNQRIQFLEDDHRLSSLHAEHSQFIQLIDLILGTSRQVLDFSSLKRWKIKAGHLIRPLVASSVESYRKYEKKKFRTYNRIIYSFFPKNMGAQNSDLNPSNFYYTGRRIALPPGDGDYQQLEFKL